MSQTSTLTEHDQPDSSQSSLSQILNDEDLSASEAAIKCFKRYARENPEVVALWALGVGFVLGWKLKPW